MKVNYRHSEYERILPFLLKLKDVYDGNIAIKSKGDFYLNKGTKENEKKYNERLLLASFYPHYKKSINNFSNMIFRKAPEIKVKDKYKDFIEKNIDGEGSSLQQVMKLAVNKALNYGLSFLWIDAPAIEGYLSMKEKEELGFLPFIKVLDRLEVINWKIENENGRKVLSKLVIEQEIEDSSDGFKEEKSKIWIVLEKFGGTIYKKTKNDFEVVKTWTNNLGFVPVIPIYSDKTGLLNANLPFLDLADLNLKHYNLESQLDNALAIVGNPQPVIWGFETDEDSQEVVVGVSHAILLGDKNTSDIKYLEVEGKSLDKLENRIKEIEVKMDKISLNVIYSTSFKTATEARFNEEKNNLFLVEISENLEYGFRKALDVVEIFLGESIGYSLTINKEFVDYSLDSVMVDELIKLREKNFISTDTLWNRLIKGNVVDISDFNIEKQKIEDEIVEIL